MSNDFEDLFNERVKQASSEEYRRIRKLQNLSQVQAAEALGFSLRNYQKLENAQGTASLTKHISNIWKLMMSHIGNIGKPQPNQEIEKILQRIVSPADGDKE